MAKYLIKKEWMPSKDFWYFAYKESNGMPIAETASRTALECEKKLRDFVKPLPKIPPEVVKELEI